MDDENRFTGSYDGQIYEVDTRSEGLGRVKVFVPGVLEKDDKAPWASVRRPVGARFNEGSFIPLKIDDYVEVIFRNGGDQRYPHIVGSLLHAPNGLLNAPHDAVGGPKVLDGSHDRPSVEEGYDQPSDTPYNTPAFTMGDLTFKILRGRLTVTSRKTNTSFEISEKGNIDLFAKESLFLRAKKKLVLKASEIKLVVAGKFGFQTESLEATVQNLRLHSKGNALLKSNSQLAIIGGAIQMISAGALTISSEDGQIQKANGELLQKIAQNLTTSPDIAWGAFIDAVGAPISSISMSSLGALISENLLAGFGFDETGLFQFENVATSLKELLTISLELSDALGDAGKDIDVLTGTGLSSKPVNQADFIQLKMKSAEIKAKLALLLK